MSNRPQRDLTVLVIDDCTSTLSLVHNMLRDEYRILVASSGEAGIESARRHRPDLILLDIRLPDLDGFQVCFRLKASDATETIPIIFMSASTDDADHDMAFRAGGVDFIQKPLRRVEVQNRVYNQVRQRVNEQLIKRQALYDDLTNLPNRTLSYDRLRYAMAQDRRDQLKTALLFVDLDHFKAINDTLGHEAGDQLLMQAALRFQQHVRRGDTVGRLGGDEFVIVLASLRRGDDAKTVAENILRAFEQPLQLGGVTKRISVSIGIALSPDDSTEPNQLMANADTAMYQAKKQGRGCIKFYTTMMNVDVARRILLERHLHDAIARDELFLNYQPVLDVARDVVVAGEALLRWRNPALGAVRPDEFIRQAEHSGLIWSIGEYVIRQACTDFRDLRNHDGEPVRLSVNVSAQQIRRAGFPRLVATVLVETGFPAQRLEIEVTEHLLLSRGGVIESNLKQLREMGVRLAMDDFGTGFSSLSYLSQHRFDTLKIDRQFIESMVVDECNDGLVSASIAMARALKIQVVAEGVETQAQMQSLEAKACRFAQGNFISPPVALEQFRGDVLAVPRAPRGQPRLRLVSRERDEPGGASAAGEA